MTQKKLIELADKCAEIMNTEVEKIYEEEDISDAGFELKNNYSLQYAPYCDDPFLFKFWDGKCLIQKTETMTTKELVVWCENYVKEKVA